MLHGTHLPGNRITQINSSQDIGAEKLAEVRAEGSGDHTVSQELLEAAREATTSDGVVEGQTDTEALAKAMLADGKVTDGEQQFINALTNQELVTEINQADFDPSNLNFEDIPSTPQTTLTREVNQAARNHLRTSHVNQWNVNQVKTAIFTGNEYTNNQPGISIGVREAYGITRENIVAWERGETAIEGPFAGKTLAEVTEQMANDMSLDSQNLYGSVKLLSQLGRAINSDRLHEGELTAQQVQASNATLDSADQMVGQKWEQYHAQADRELHSRVDGAMEELRQAQASGDQERIEEATLQANQANNDALAFNQTMTDVRVTQMTELGESEERRNRAAEQLYKGGKLEGNTGHIEDAIDGDNRFKTGLPEGYVRNRDMIRQGDAMYAGDPQLNPHRTQVQETLAQGVVPYASDALERRDEQLTGVDERLDLDDEVSDEGMERIDEDLEIPESDQQIFEIYQDAIQVRDSYAAQIDALRSRELSPEEEQQLTELENKKAKLDQKVSQLSERARALGTFEDNIREKAEGKHETYEERIEEEEAAREREEEVFPNGVESVRIDNIDQGALGDCYFLAAVVGAVDRDPQAVKDMITINDDGTYDVKFPGADEAVTVNKDDINPAYAEAGPDGLWLAILERAYAQYDNENSVIYENDDPYDSIEGGRTHTGINIMTGHDTDGDVLSVTTLSTTREKLMAALPPGEKGRLVSVGTRNNIPWVENSKYDNGIVHGHAYAVIAFDPETDMVTIRNPHGNNSEKGSQFTMPLSEMDEYFSSINYEEAE